MARCHSCDHNISYLGYINGTFKLFWKNLARQSLPIFPCPHCGTECQEHAGSVFGLFGLMMSAGLIAVFFMKQAGKDTENVFFAVGIMVSFVIMQIAWWYNVSKLKEPLA